MGRQFARLGLGHLGVRVAALLRHSDKSGLRGPGQRNIRRQAGGNVSAMPQRDLLMVRRPALPYADSCGAKRVLSYEFE
jgi:hypothetical protein